MITVKNKNKLLTVDERELDYYLKDGYDHVEYDHEIKDYKVIKPAKGKLVPYEGFLKLQQENEKLKAEIERLKADSKAAKK